MSLPRLTKSVKKQLLADHSEEELKELVLQQARDLGLDETSAPVKRRVRLLVQAKKAQEVPVLDLAEEVPKKKKGKVKRKGRKSRVPDTVTDSMGDTLDESRRRKKTKYVTFS